MNSEILLEELLGLLEANNVAIRRDALGGSGGGLCEIKGRRIFFLDTDSSKLEAASFAAQAVSKIVDIDDIYLRPAVRDFIESQQN